MDWNASTLPIPSPPGSLKDPLRRQGLQHFGAPGDLLADLAPPSGVVFFLE